MFKYNIWTLLFFSLFIYLPLIAFAQSSFSEQQINFKFAFITDTHFGRTEFDGEKLTTDIWLKQALTEIGSKKVDFIIHGGDIIDTNGNLALYDEYDAVVAPFISKSLPIFYVPGDHDIGHFQSSITQENIDSWIHRGYAGNNSHEYYGFVHKGAAFFVINTMAYRSESDAVRQRAEDQLDAMDKFFKENANIPVKIICGHIAPFIDEVSEENDANGFNIEKPYREKLLNIMAKYKIRYYFAGHRHENQAVQSKGIVVFNNAALSYQLGEDTLRGYNIYAVSKEGIQVEFFAIGNENKVKDNNDDNDDKD